MSKKNRSGVNLAAGYHGGIKHIDLVTGRSVFKIRGFWNLHHVDGESVTDVSNELSAFIFRVKWCNRSWTFWTV
jgi:hypothetical protein